MNPEQFNAPLPPPGGNPYEFINNAGKPPRRGGGLSPGGNPFVAKLVFIIGGAIILIIVVVLVVNLLFGSRTNVGDLITLTQTEQEIVRVTTLPQQGATDQVVAGAAISTRLTVLTQQQKMLAYLATHGTKVGTKELALKKDAKTDVRLTEATATSTFDIVFTQIMRAQLDDYATSLHTSYENSSSKTAKQLLATDYAQVQMLLKQWPTQ